MADLPNRSWPAAVLPVASAALVLSLTGCGPAAHERSQVSVGGQTFRVEVARTDRQHQRGLSGRSSVAADSGMLFAFSGRKVQKVWMADMLVPLDVAWVADDAVVAVRTLQPCPSAKSSDCPTWTSPQPVAALLEVPAGALDGVVPGSAVDVSNIAG